MSRGSLNYFSTPGFLKFDNRKGTLHSRGGMRMLGISEDFLRGFVEACEYETGPATPALLRRCGEFFGRRLALWFERELSQHAAASIREREMAEFSALFHDLWRGLGLGVITVDWRYGGRGVLAITVEDSAMSSIALEEHVGEDMFEGLLEGFFTSFCDGPITCVQTGDARLGDKQGTTFVIVPRAREAELRGLKEQGGAHTELVAAMVA